ncbi:flavin reductase family protein [Leucobacter sp. USCH14]|uniref:flavin reductase family protein n=1 Tax=Leucobacter sp. USCH14 TaxID=3024838 RepID=UPI0030B5EB8C
MSASAFAVAVAPTAGSAPVAHAAAPVAFDQREFRDAMGGFASGITVITTHGPDGPVGFTCQSFTSISIDPPLVSFSISRTSRSLAALREHGQLVVNFLSARQQALSGQFARSGTDKWAGVAWSRSEINGAPTLERATGWVAGEIAQEIEAGDHLIFLVAVSGIFTDRESAPLLFFRGAYHELASQPRGGVDSAR